MKAVQAEASPAEPGEHHGLQLRILWGMMQREQGGGALPQKVRYFCGREGVLRHVEADGVQVQVDPLRLEQPGAGNEAILCAQEKIGRLHAQGDVAVLCVVAETFQHAGNAGKHP